MTGTLRAHSSCALEGTVTEKCFPSSRCPQTPREALSSWVPVGPGGNLLFVPAPCLIINFKVQNQKDWRKKRAAVAMAPDQLLLQRFSCPSQCRASRAAGAPRQEEPLPQRGAQLQVGTRCWPPILGDIPRPCGVRSRMFSPLPTRGRGRLLTAGPRAALRGGVGRARGRVPARCEDKSAAINKGRMLKFPAINTVHYTGLLNAGARGRRMYS